jgi:hypothetical protein
MLNINAEYKPTNNASKMKYMGLYNLCEEIYLLEKGKTKKLLFKKVVQKLPFRKR